MLDPDICICRFHRKGPFLRSLATLLDNLFDSKAGRTRVLGIRSDKGTGGIGIGQSFSTFAKIATS